MIIKEFSRFSVIFQDVFYSSCAAQSAAKKPLTEDELHLLICSTKEKMLQAAANLDFELAAKLRDKLFELQGKAPEEIPEETVSLPQRRKSRKKNKYLKA